MQQPLKNSFAPSEWSASIADLGTLLPLSFALVIYNGFAPSQLFLLWGLVYVLTGSYFKIPLSVQPLKVMSVVAISHELSPDFMSGTAVFYGLFFVIISGTGAIRWMERWFSQALVKGIQLGIGLILAQKAINLVLDHGFLLQSKIITAWLNPVILGGALVLIWYFQFKRKQPATVVFIVLSVLVVWLIQGPPVLHPADTPSFRIMPPKLSLLPDALLLLMLPQLPLTLGNAVFAASDACHTLWKKQAQRVSPTTLGYSIGIFDTAIGLLGGVPMCHGAGGMAAHARFGGRTGGTTIIMGGLLTLLALIPHGADLIFLVPVPLLGAMLLFDSWMMILLFRSLDKKLEIVTAITVGLVSVLTRNLTIALIVGLLIEQGQPILSKRINKFQLGRQS